MALHSNTSPQIGSDRGQRRANLRLSDCRCPICMYILIEPVTMPCSHELCLTCFQQNVQEANLCCPLCRKRISTWARRAVRNKKLVDENRWLQIQEAFPRQVRNRLQDKDEGEDELEDTFIHIPSIAEPGEIREEYEKELKRLDTEREKKAREEEQESRDLIARLQAEEEACQREQEELIRQDEELVRKIMAEGTPALRNTPKNTLLDRFVSRAASHTSTCSSPSTSSSCNPTPHRRARRSPTLASLIPPPSSSPSPAPLIQPPSSSPSPAPSTSRADDQSLVVHDDITPSLSADLHISPCLSTSSNSNTTARSGDTSTPGLPIENTSAIPRLLTRRSESPDSLKLEMCHFKPIHASPKTPTRLVVNGRPVDPPVIRSTPRNLKDFPSHPPERGAEGEALSMASPLVRSWIQTLARNRSENVAKSSKCLGPDTPPLPTPPPLVDRDHLTRPAPTSTDTGSHRQDDKTVARKLGFDSVASTSDKTISSSPHHSQASPQPSTSYHIPTSPTTAKTHLQASRIESPQPPSKTASKPKGKVKITSNNSASGISNCLDKDLGKEEQEWNEKTTEEMESRMEMVIKTSEIVDENTSDSGGKKDEMQCGDGGRNSLILSECPVSGDVTTGHRVVNSAIPAADKVTNSSGQQASCEEKDDPGGGGDEMTNPTVKSGEFIKEQKIKAAVVVGNKLSTKRPTKLPTIEYPDSGDDFEEATPKKTGRYVSPKKNIDRKSSKSSKTNGTPRNAPARPRVTRSQMSPKKNGDISNDEKSPKKNNSRTGVGKTKSARNKITEEVIQCKQKTPTKAVTSPGKNAPTGDQCTPTRKRGRPRKNTKYQPVTETVSEAGEGDNVDKGKSEKVDNDCSDKEITPLKRGRSTEDKENEVSNGEESPVEPLSKRTRLNSEEKQGGEEVTSTRSPRRSAARPRFSVEYSPGDYGKTIKKYPPQKKCKTSKGTASKQTKLSFVTSDTGSSLKQQTKLGYISDKKSVDKVSSKGRNVNSKGRKSAAVSKPPKVGTSAEMREEIEEEEPPQPKVLDRSFFSSDEEYKMHIEEQDRLLALQLQADFDLESKFRLTAIRRKGTEGQYEFRRKNQPRNSLCH